MTTAAELLLDRAGADTPALHFGDRTWTYRELVETTEWEKYGRGRDPRCANCMAHCGYEPTAVLQSATSPRESLRALRASL